MREARSWVLLGLEAGPAPGRVGFGSEACISAPSEASTILCVIVCVEGTVIDVGTVLCVYCYLLTLSSASAIAS